MSSSEAFFVSRTLQAIEVLAFQPSSAPQVAGALRVHPRTARRLLNKLVAEGWLTCSEGRRRIYAPTMRIVALAAHLAERDPLAGAARPAVTRLHEETGLVAHLAIPSYRSTLCLVHRAGGPDARPQLRELVPAHATAAGKVLLAHRDAWRESVLERPLDRLTPATMTDRVALEIALAQVATQGHAVDDGEFLARTRSVATPVRDGSGVVAAALALAGDDAAMDDASMARLVALLRERARQIEQANQAGGNG